MLLVLSSCGIPKLRDPQPGPLLPTNYTAGFPGSNSLENSSQVPVEDFFRDPLLTRLICQGLAGNQELKILFEDVQIASNEVLGRSGAYLPFVSFGLGAGIERASRFTPLGAAEHDLEYLPGKHFPELLGNFLVAADFSWQIDIWRALRNSRDSAKLRFFATADGRNYAVTRLVAEIAERYYELLALDMRMDNLNNIIALQEQSLRAAESKLKFARGTALGVQRFQAEIRLNQSQKLITRQAIIEAENRINFLLGRYPQPVERRVASLSDFIDMNLHALSVGVPPQLLQNRPDVRQAERELEANGLDVKVARARFFPQLAITGPLGPLGPNSPVGVQAFNPKYLFWSPESLLVSAAADLVVPVINKRAIQADYKTANARQLQSVYNYQRVVLNAFTEVVTRVYKVQNLSQSIEIKKEQVRSLEAAVDFANKLYLRAFAPAAEAERRIDYMDVLFAQRDLWEARLLLIETKQQQLSAIVGVYQALGGGLWGCGCANPNAPPSGPGPNQPPPAGAGSATAAPAGPPGSDKLPDQLPEPRKVPEPDKAPNPGKLPERPPEPGKVSTLPSSNYAPGLRLE